MLNQKFVKQFFIHKMKLKQVREQIGEIDNRMKAVETLCEKENRERTPEEDKVWDADLAELDRLADLKDKLEKEEATRARIANRVPTTFDTGTAEKKEQEQAQKRFSFGKAIRAAYGEKLDGIEAEMHQEGVSEMGKLGITNSNRSVIVPNMIVNRAALLDNGTAPVESVGFVDGVYANTILGDLGVTRINAQADARLTVIPSFTTQWEGEADAAADGGSAVTPVNLTPKRLASYADFSMQLAMQHNESVEDAIRRGLQEAIAAKVEYACFTDDSGNGAYNYLGNGKTAVTAATAAALVQAVVEEVLGNNHLKGSLGFAISHDLYAEIVNAAMPSAVARLYENGMIQAMPAYFSSQVADIALNQESIYFGNWSKVNIAQFGGLEFTVDSYTQKVSGKDRLIVNSFWDMALAQDAAISVGGYTG